MQELQQDLHFCTHENLQIYLCERSVILVWHKDWSSLFFFLSVVSSVCDWHKCDFQLDRNQDGQESSQGACSDFPQVRNPIHIAHVFLIVGAKRGRCGVKFTSVCRRFPPHLLMEFTPQIITPLLLSFLTSHPSATITLELVCTGTCSTMGTSNSWIEMTPCFVAAEKFRTIPLATILARTLWQPWNWCY